MFRDYAQGSHFVLYTDRLSLKRNRYHNTRRTEFKGELWTWVPTNTKSCICVEKQSDYGSVLLAATEQGR